jgi:hypothetical protein
VKKITLRNLPTASIFATGRYRCRALAGSIKRRQQGFMAMHLVGFGSGGNRRIAITYTADANNVNVFSAAGSPTDPVDVVVTVNSGIVIGSTSTGTPAFTTGSGWNINSSLELHNSGTICGRGGAGGSGGSSSGHTEVVGKSTNEIVDSCTNGNGGGSGGPALTALYRISIWNYGTIGGGGGGGGGGGARAWGNQRAVLGGGGGGGGQGRDNTGSNGGGSASWAGGSPMSGSSGGTGTASGAGGGGNGGNYIGSTFAGAGASGGGLGNGGGTGGSGSGTATHTASGAGGGSAGACTSSGSNANITWMVIGTRYGSVL